MSEGPLDAWSDVTEWSAQLVFSVTEDHDIIRSTGSNVVGKSHTRWQVVASGRLSGPVASSWQGDGLVSGSWVEGSNADESAQGWIEYYWSTVSGSGTGTGTIFLQMSIDITNGAPGVGRYSLQATGLEFDVTTTSYTYTKDPVSGIPSESYDISPGQRDVSFSEEVDQPLPHSGLVLRGNKQVSLSGSAIGNISWSLIPVLGPCPFGRIDIDPSDTKTHEISSTLLGTVPQTLRHFVTINGTGDVVLRATIFPDTPLLRSKVTWEADGARITSPAQGADRLTAKISRNRPTGARIPVKLKIEGHICFEVVVWIIWCKLKANTNTHDISSINKRPLGPHPHRNGHDDGYVAVAGIDWTATIQPPRIITDNDRPAIEAQPRVAPPGTTKTNHYELGVAGPGNPDVSGSGFSGWDMSRQKRVKIFRGNPDKVPPEPITETTKNDPDPGSRPVDYPANDIEGNDDLGPRDEDSNPYDEATHQFPGRGKKGTLRSADQPNSEFLDAEFEDGETFRVRQQNSKKLNGQWNKEPGQTDVFDTTNDDFPP